LSIAIWREKSISACVRRERERRENAAETTTACGVARRARGYLTDTGTAPERIYRNPRVSEVTGYHQNYLRQLVRAGKFPPPIRLGGPGSRAVGWLESDILAYQRERIAKRDAGA